MAILIMKKDEPAKPDMGEMESALIQQVNIAKEVQRNHADCVGVLEQKEDGDYECSDCRETVHNG